MLILALDTTNEMGGVGIFNDAECLATAPNVGPANRYSVSLFEMAETVLVRAGLELRDIELFAVANGPGSFTGIRIGLAAARAWGKAFGKPVRGVSVLEALVSKAGPNSEWALPMLDARRGEFFLGAFRRTRQEGSEADERDYKLLDTGWVLKPEPMRSLLEKLVGNGASATCLVRAHDEATAALRPTLPTSLGWQRVEGPLVEAVASIARRDLMEKSPCADPQLDAYYLRRPDAEIHWKD
jgi:tRNA threonylcarbamoyl adenosine modification protein YeaZ